MIVEISFRSKLITPDQSLSLFKAKQTEEIYKVPTELPLNMAQDWAVAVVTHAIILPGCHNMVNRPKADVKPPIQDAMEGEVASELLLY